MMRRKPGSDIVSNLLASVVLLMAVGFIAWTAIAFKLYERTGFILGLVGMIVWWSLILAVPLAVWRAKRKSTTSEHEIRIRKALLIVMAVLILVGFVTVTGLEPILQHSLAYHGSLFVTIYMLVPICFIAAGFLAMKCVQRRA